MDQPTMTTRAPDARDRTAVVIEGIGIVKTYRRGPELVKALRGVDVELRAGELTALVGPSGSGKTTLLNILCGWEDPDQGTVVWHGTDPRRRPRDRRWDELAIVPQDLGLVSEVTVAENVLLPLWLSGSFDAAGRARAIDLLERLNLGAYLERSPSELSIGEQQRLAIARAMITRPRLLLADEPTGHQDAGSAELVYAAFRTLTEDGTACLVATHSEELLQHVGRVITMRDGRIGEGDDGTADGGDGGEPVPRR
jgi:ABC-type lipoprotein export system ATPase subunit